MFTLDQEERRKRQYQQKNPFYQKSKIFHRSFQHILLMSHAEKVTCGHTQLQKRLGKARKKGVEIGHWLG